ncbi:MAG: hypothetical protein COV07_01910 [Candidatus Vogelbacteria bacterium CG10_big_fil_rev_8_21_14_0_10_45_14]|uniref:M23ase beta-sheet core domain-containing protein n=1 Tax=Candidatus Vogelbacteria bacterium CG10_big_fil_rev_8_21_14_0_10_45_14 TaxID=1975042 RepID=A0A2H0RKC8_9BACT|nr:MAG: hypothetical protein COV07_01910 [Candidatus Vogelbacteria bacterium CG10_big_fil_rev_8_21_14_0_10_45_14]
MRKYRSQILVLLFVTLGFFAYPSFSIGDEVKDLQERIDTRTGEIQELEAEIKKIEKELKLVGAEKATLSSKLSQIELTRKKLSADLSITQKKIDAVNVTLQELGTDIDSKGNSILNSKIGIAEMARSLREIDDISLVELMLGVGNLGAAMDKGASLVRISQEVDSRIRELKTVRADLETSRKEVATEQAKLLSLHKEFRAKKTIEDANIREAASILKQTAGKETAYMKILADKEALREAFEAELFAFEAQLKIAIDPSTLPTAGSKVLLWPLRDVLITQYFGSTEFSKSALGAVYSGKGHNGVDLRASIGTRIYAAASGIIIGSGDTDDVCKGASYGKWVLIEHSNGLTTLYAHLSHIDVVGGEKVVSGDGIGYSGNTGYSTGPHLHFSVFASKGVSVGQLKSKNPRCGTYTLPIASLNSYLNPLSFL